jgi:hypothetical protein
MSIRLCAAGAIAGLAAMALSGPTVAQYPSTDACGYYEFPVGSPEYRVCVEREIEARRLGRMQREYGAARIVSDSERACAYYGLPPGSPRFDRCVRREVDLRSPQ